MARVKKSVLVCGVRSDGSAFKFSTPNWNEAMKRAIWLLKTNKSILRVFMVNGAVRFELDHSDLTNAS
jgi:hypothetical protein